jgi:CRISPR-associated protein Cas2
MIVLVVSRATPSLRGRLTRWLLQLKPGIFVGTLSKRVRERLWKATCESLRSGWAVMLYSAKTEQGFEIQAFGPAPVQFEDMEGIWLAKKQFPP